MDKMEVGAGHHVPFELNYVDYYDDHKRYPQKSPMWFTNLLEDAPKGQQPGPGVGMGMSMSMEVWIWNGRYYDN